MDLSINKVFMIPQLLGRAKKFIKFEENEKLKTKEWGPTTQEKKV